MSTHHYTPHILYLRSIYYGQTQQCNPIPILWERPHRRRSHSFVCQFHCGRSIVFDKYKCRQNNNALCLVCVISPIVVNVFNNCELRLFKTNVNVSNWYVCAEYDTVHVHYTARLCWMTAACSEHSWLKRKSHPPAANYDGIWTLAQLISVESNVWNPIQSEFNGKMQSGRENNIMQCLYLQFNTRRNDGILWAAAYWEFMHGCPLGFYTSLTTAPIDSSVVCACVFFNEILTNRNVASELLDV